MNLGGSELLILVFFVAQMGLFVLAVVALVLAAVQPTALWRGAGISKPLWLTFAAVSLLIPIVGGILALGYFFVISPKLEAARRREPAVV